MDQRAIAQAAELLVAARRTGQLLDALPDACKPRTLEDAIAIQDATLAALGETVAGWKAALVGGRVQTRPDATAIAGIFLVTLAGMFTFIREEKRGVPFPPVWTMVFGRSRGNG